MSSITPLFIPPRRSRFGSKRKPRPRLFSYGSPTTAREFRPTCWTRSSIALPAGRMPSRAAAASGLAIAKGFIQIHRRHDRGLGNARRRRNLPHPAALGKAARFAHTGRMSRNPPSILVIDDEVQMRRMLRISLEAAGYRVWEAESAELGLVEAASRKPDVVVLDLGLPDRDGIDVLKRLREWSPVPVVVLSVRDNESDKVAALDAGRGRLRDQAFPHR